MYDFFDCLIGAFKSTYTNTIQWNLFLLFRITFQFSEPEEEHYQENQNCTDGD